MKTPIVTSYETEEGKVKFEFRQRVVVTRPIPLHAYEPDPRDPPETVEVVASDAKMANLVWRLHRDELEAYIQELQELLDGR